MRFTAAATIFLIACSPSFARSKPACHDRGGTYVNVDGNTIPDPACLPKNAHVTGETAVCRDGSHSFSQHHSGTCSGHGGVAQWE